MNRIRSLAIVAALVLALTALAQTTTPSGVPTAESQLKLFTTRLDLTADQQAKVKPILQELQAGTEKIVQDETLSHAQQMQSVRPLRLNADKKIREVLTDDQKKKLDQLEQEPHPELHGNLN
jgi:Spy/CpxP family protein refolding chaperone